MEQYELDPRFSSRDVLKIFKQFRPVHVFIRRVGSQGGGKIVNENVEKRALEVKRGVNELAIFIDGEKRFSFTQDPPRSEFQWGRRFSVAYEREPLVMAATGFEDPYDPSLPPIRSSVLRSVNRGYLLEITFDGTIPLEKTRPWHAPIFNWRVRRRVKRS